MSIDRAIDQAIAALGLLKSRPLPDKDPEKAEALAEMASAIATAIDPLFETIALQGRIASFAEPYNDICGAAITSDLYVALLTAADQRLRRA